jgi:hypothetical protein
MKAKVDPPRKELALIIRDTEFIPATKLDNDDDVYLNTLR